ncbi:beta-fructofuranosidase [Enterococcus sp. AZ163]
MTPKYDHESHGIFSGSSLASKDKLYLFYTANNRDSDWVRHSSQALAWINKDGSIEKLEKPLIPKPPEGYTDNFKDPKVLKHERIYYMFVGGQTDEQTGCILTYQSNDLSNWLFKGPLEINVERLGFMWGCPDVFSIDGKDLLMLSPQGLSSKGHQFQNVYHSGTFIGEHQIAENIFRTAGEFQELDCGFDFYAPQTTLGPDNRRILIGWMGLPDTIYPADVDGWANCLTIPRELSIKQNRLIQKPVAELMKFRQEAYQIEVELVSEQLEIANANGRPVEIHLILTNVGCEQAGIKFNVSE